MKIKICGLTRRRDVEICEELGVDILGFVVEYPREVPWNLTRRQAKELIDAAIRPTCIVTGGVPEMVIALAKEIKPDMLQLHYKETAAQTAGIAGELKKSGIKTIKAVYDDAEIEVLCRSDIYAILVDSRTAENAATNIKEVDVDLFNRIKKISNKPLIIAGGIIPENVADIIAATKADSIDVMTGVELSPGIKDRIKIEALVREVARCGRMKIRNDI